jgi:hypothetical protein
VVTSDGRLFDLKKTRSAVPRRFYWQAKDLAYDLQIAHLALGYQHRCGTEPVEAGVIAFEWPSDPAAAIDCSLLIFDGQDLQTGLQRREEAFHRIAACLRPAVLAFPKAKELIWIPLTSSDERLHPHNRRSRALPFSALRLCPGCEQRGPAGVQRHC